MRWKYDYTNRAFGKTFIDGAMCFWNYWIKKRVMVCDIYANDDFIQDKEYYIREDNWTDEKLAILHEKGYKKCENLPDHDNIGWIGVPVMVKFHGFKTIETDCKDSPMFLNDRMQSNLLNKFAKSLARAAVIGGMDIQKLILMAGIGVAAVFGMKVLGVF